MKYEIIDTQIVNEVKLHINLLNNTWGLTNEELARGFGVTEATIRSQKSRHSEELVENKHFHVLQNATGNSNKIIWTQRGIVRLGFMLNSTPQTIKFRDWAEDYIIKDTTQQLPQNYISALEALIESEKEKEQLAIDNKSKALKITQDAPKVQFAENVSDAVNSILIGSYGKALSKEYGVKIGQNKLFAYLRTNDILIKDGRRKNDPMQKYIDNDYFILKESDVITPKGVRVVTTTLITGKGQLALASKIIEHFSK